VHIRKLDNNRVGENTNPKPNTPPPPSPPNSCLTHIGHKNHIKCPPSILVMKSIIFSIELLKKTFHFNNHGNQIGQILEQNGKGVKLDILKNPNLL
jgi:hypothetical protein